MQFGIQAFSPVYANQMGVVGALRMNGKFRKK